MLYLPNHSEKKVDSDYIKGLLNGEFTTFKYEKEFVIKKPLTWKVPAFLLYSIIEDKLSNQN